MSREKSAVVPSSKAAALVRASFAPFQAFDVKKSVALCLKLLAYAYRTCWSAKGSGTMIAASTTVDKLISYLEQPDENDM